MDYNKLKKAELIDELELRDATISGMGKEIYELGEKLEAETARADAGAESTKQLIAQKRELRDRLDNSKAVIEELESDKGGKLMILIIGVVVGVIGTSIAFANSAM